MRCKFLILALVAGLGCATPVHTLRFHEEVPGNLPDSRVRRITIATTHQHLAVNPFPTLTEKDVYAARLEMTPDGPAVALQFDAHGIAMLTEMTTRLRGQSFAVLVDEKPVAAWLVERAIGDGKFLLLGDLTDEEAAALVESLNRQAGRWRDAGDERLTPRP